MEKVYWAIFLIIGVHCTCSHVHTHIRIYDIRSWVVHCSVSTILGDGAWHAVCVHKNGSLLDYYSIQPNNRFINSNCSDRPSDRVREREKACRMPEPINVSVLQLGRSNQSIQWPCQSAYTLTLHEPIFGQWILIIMCAAQVATFSHHNDMVFACENYV